MKSPRGSNLLLRTAVVIVMALSIGAPTPGRISGCSTGSAGGVDPTAYCEGFELRVCTRDHAIHRIDDAEFQACLDAYPAVCAGTGLPAGCVVTQSAAVACYDALVDPDRLAIEATFSMPNLPECNICSGAAGVDLEGI